MTLNAEHMCISRPSPSTKYHICLTNSICMSNSTTVVAVQWLSHVRHFVTPWTAARQASLSFTIFQNLLKLMSIELMMPSNHFILHCALLFLPSVYPSLFSNEWALHIKWPKYWSFSISPSKNQGWFNNIKTQFILFCHHTCSLFCILYAS